LIGTKPMSFLLHPLQVVLAVLSESICREQEKVIEYLQLENQILREKLGGKRVLLSDDQRRVLAMKGKALGRQQLGKIATIAQADTILRWHRELIEPQGDSKPSHNTGRPPMEQEVVDLVLRMARENVSWGYKRIEGALHNLGYAICSSTVANILKQHGIEPAPTRKRTTSTSARNGNSTNSRTTISHCCPTIYPSARNPSRSLNLAGNVGERTRPRAFV
jgi:putative transposase